MRLSVDRPVPTLSSVDWDQPRAGSYQSVDRTVDCSFATVDRAVDRALSRPASMSFSLPLTSDLCALLYLLYLLSPYKTFLHMPTMFINISFPDLSEGKRNIII